MAWIVSDFKPINAEKVLFISILFLVFKKQMSQDDIKKMK